MKNKIFAVFLFLFCLPLFLAGSTDSSRSILSRIPKNESPLISTSSSNAQKQESPEEKKSPDIAPPTTTHTAQPPTAPSNDIKKSSVIPEMPTPPAEVDLSEDIKEEAEYASRKASSEEEKAPSATPTPAEKKSPLEEKELEETKKIEEKEQKISFYFEDATLENLVKYMENLFNVTFLPDDAIKPTMQGGGTLAGQKISFKTNKPLTREQAWDVFNRFLDLAQLTIVPGAIPNFYRITSVTAANTDPLPTYFGADLIHLPNNASKVRYVYFVKNIPLTTAQNIASSLSSTTAKVNTFPDLDALILTDKSINIRSLMKIVEEFDKEMPEAMSILKLKRTEAQAVANLYADLTKMEAPSGPGRYLTQRKQPQSGYFPMDARIIPEPRTNSLILLGPKKALEKIEEFIVKHVDVELDMPYSPLHVYNLQYTDATNVASILSKVITFGSGTTAAQFGGTLDGEKYFKSVQITPEPAGNKLIIKAEDNDFNKLKEIIEQIDVVQPQVAIEALIVDVSIDNNKALGTQIRNKSDGSVLNNVNFQTSGIQDGDGNSSVITNTTNKGLIGNLLNLALGSVAGTTVFSFGNPSGTDNPGVWGILKILKTYAHTNIISTPFIIATNKTPAQFSSGSTRRIVTAIIGGNGTQSVTGQPANLTLKLTPQISSEGTIHLQIDIEITEFSNTTVQTDGNTLSKTISTAVTLKNGEVIALGGITKNKITDTVYKVPLLGDIPLIGTFFRTKQKLKTRNNLFIFISPKIIVPNVNRNIDYYTQRQLDKTRQSLSVADATQMTRDPLDRLFFGGEEKQFVNELDTFLTPDPQKKSRRTLKKTAHKVVGARAQKPTPEANPPRTKRLTKRRKGI